MNDQTGTIKTRWKMINFSVTKFSARRDPNLT